MFEHVLHHFSSTKGEISWTYANYWRSVAFAATFAAAWGAQAQDKVIRIGVLNDQSGLYADLAGQGSVVAAKMAVEDFGEKPAKVEILSADHQNKPDVGSNIARQWFDQRRRRRDRRRAQLGRGARGQRNRARRRTRSS